jgi:hypothetical protein
LKNLVERNNLRDEDTEGKTMTVGQIRCEAVSRALFNGKAFDNTGSKGGKLVLRKCLPKHRVCTELLAAFYQFSKQHSG